MVLSAIVAVAKNGVIGDGMKMPWRLPAEAAYFKRTIKPHPVIMGRKTYEVTRKDPTPGTFNVVITHNPDYKVEPGFITVGSLDEALELPEIKQADEVFVLGGQQIFEEAMPRFDKLYVTNVDAQPEGNIHFHYDPKQWHRTWSEFHPADAENIHDYELTILDRKANN